MERWFIEEGGESTGPFDADALTLRVAARELGASTKVRLERPDSAAGKVEAGAWAELKDVPRFARLLPTSLAVSPRSPSLGALAAPARSLVRPAPLLGARWDPPVSPPAPVSAPAPVAAIQATAVVELEEVLARVRGRRDLHAEGHEKRAPRHDDAPDAAETPTATDDATPYPQSVAAPQPVALVPPTASTSPLAAPGVPTHPQLVLTPRPSPHRRGSTRPLLYLVAFAGLSFGVAIALHERRPQRAMSPGNAADSRAATGGKGVSETLGRGGGVGSAGRSQGNLSVGIVEGLPGSGPAAKNGDHVKVNYAGSLPDGTEFDSSRAKGSPFAFTLGKGAVIQGWDQGILGMKVGGTRKLTVPPSLGYGSRTLGKIPPNSTLLFDVELVAIAPR